MSIKIRNFNKFQHFKDRRPPWIKLYRDLLDDMDWHALSGDDAKALTMLWLLASEDEQQKGGLPEPSVLAFRLRISERQIKQTLTRLNKWLIHDDIAVISERYQGDAPETETETEIKTETEEKRASAPPARKKSTRWTEDTIPDDWLNWAVEYGCSRSAAIVEAETFVDHWRSVTKNATKVDWYSTWRNWIRRSNGNGQHKNTSGNNGSGRLSAPERVRAAYTKILDAEQATDGELMDADVGDLRP